jgi:hypothetical protein
VNRPKTSQMVIDEFARIIDSQDAKGIEKYGVTIDDATGYNWSLMALEEAADLQKYLIKRIAELVQLKEQLNQDLAEAEESNNWLTQQLLGAKDKIRELKSFDRVRKNLQLHEQNLQLAKEIDKLNGTCRTHGV